MRRPVLALCVTLVLLPGCTSDSALDLEVGDCLQQESLSTGEVRSVETVECAAEHDAEVFAEHQLPGDEHPGQQEVSALADAACARAFEEFVGVPHAESELTYSSLSPTEAGWDTSGDRSVLCVVLSDTPVTGSLEGVGR